MNRVTHDLDFRNDFSLFVYFFPVFQIWDLADPDGKGYLDKQVGTR